MPEWKQMTTVAERRTTALITNGKDRADCAHCGIRKLMLFSDAPHGYRLINEFTTARLTVIVSAERVLGWNTIIWLKSGGGMAATYLSHIINGARYIEGQRVPADTTPPGKRYLAEELVFEKGIPLAPCH